mgnify:FL=1
MILQTTSQLDTAPKKIVSLVPSQTELLYHLGLSKETIGITKFCIHPKIWHKTKTRVGATKNINIDSIRKLQPNLIIANKEENVREQIEEIAKEYPVWVTDVNNLAEALQMIGDIGQLTGKSEKALALLNGIKMNFAAIRPVTDEIRAAYLIWQKPYMAVGGGTFIDDMLTKCGLKNIYAHKTRYPQISLAQLQTHSCQLLLLSTEPFPFTQKHVDELSIQLPGIRIVLADGEMFSWYGSRMLKAPGYFKNLIKKLQV